MASFPHFPTPLPPSGHPFHPPPPTHFVPPPPPHAIPPPPHFVPPPPHAIPPPPHFIPPPPHAIPPAPHFVPPPPPHVTPPPPHVLPPPAPHVKPPPPFHPITPPPPSPSPHPGPTVIIVVFISFGCVFFLAFCMFALWCLIKKRKKKMVEETDIIRTDEHRRIKEAIVEGPNGPETVVLSIEDDKHIEEEIIKKEKVEGKHMHAESSANPSTHNTHHFLEHKD